MRKWKIIRFWKKYVAWPTETKLEQDHTILVPLGVAFFSFRFFMSEWKWPFSVLLFFSLLPPRTLELCILGSSGLLDFWGCRKYWEGTQLVSQVGPLWKKYFLSTFFKLSCFLLLSIFQRGFRETLGWIAKAVPPTQGPWSGRVFRGSALALWPISL